MLTLPKFQDEEDVLTQFWKERNRFLGNIKADGQDAKEDEHGHLESRPESAASDEEPEEQLTNGEEQLVNDEAMASDDLVEGQLSMDDDYEEAIARDQGGVELQLLVSGAIHTPQR